MSNPIARDDGGMARPRGSNREPALVWFRDDLRLADNPALAEASRDGRPVLLLYVREDRTPGVRPIGAATGWWLHHSLESLAADIGRRGARLILRRGDSRKIVPAVAREAGARLVTWNRRHGTPASADRDVAAALSRSRIESRSFKANLLFDPDELAGKGGRPFRTYSAFWRAALLRGEPRPPLPAPAALVPAPAEVNSDSLDALDLLPHVSDWTVGVGAVWTPGEAAGAARLADFVAGGLAAYAERRDRPSASSSMLSPHLRFGEISPFQVWHAVTAVPGPGTEKFRAELGWREFAHHVLGRFPALATENVDPAFDRFPWQEPFADEMWAWRRGRTGYPIVDAGMRQLWQTGWMHNRVRMIVASFLTKHLLAPWQIGEEWFWDTLVDADPASNPFGWQWAAGSGADARPYFRILNPVLQGERFDPQGTYVRRYLPEIAALPDRFIHRPWQAPPIALAAAGISLGRDYPLPIVDHAEARRRALAAFEEMRRLSRISPETPPDEARFPR